MGRLKKNLPGTTLIETLVAMTLLVTAISLSFLSVVSIKKSFNNDLRTYAYLVVNKNVEEFDSAIEISEFIDYTSFTISIRQEQYKKNPTLMVLSVSAITRDSILLYEVKELLHASSLVRKEEKKE